MVMFSQFSNEGNHNENSYEEGEDLICDFSGKTQWNFQKISGRKVILGIKLLLYFWIVLLNLEL